MRNSLESRLMSNYSQKGKWSFVTSDKLDFQADHQRLEPQLSPTRIPPKKIPKSGGGGRRGVSPKPRRSTKTASPPNPEGQPKLTSSKVFRSSGTGGTLVTQKPVQPQLTKSKTFWVVVVRGNPEAVQPVDRYIRGQN